MPKKFPGLPEQLYAQYCASVQLFRRIIDEATLYYVLRRPRELGSFRWVVDGKGAPTITQHTSTTVFEQVLTDLTPAYLAHTTTIDTIEGGDYSHFEKYFVELNKAPLYWGDLKDQEATAGVNISKLLSDNFCFAESSKEAGLQIVDILASAVTRAMNRKLQKQGWRHLGSLMVHQDKIAPFYIIPSANEVSESVLNSRNYHGYVQDCFRASAKSMVRDYLRT